MNFYSRLHVQEPNIQNLNYDLRMIGGPNFMQLIITPQSLFHNYVHVHLCPLPDI